MLSLFYIFAYFVPLPGMPSSFSTRPLTALSPISFLPVFCHLLQAASLSIWVSISSLCLCSRSLPPFIYYTYPVIGLLPLYLPPSP